MLDVVVLVLNVCGVEEEVIVLLWVFVECYLYEDVVLVYLFLCLLV